MILRQQSIDISSGDRELNLWTDILISNWDFKTLLLIVFIGGGSGFIITELSRRITTRKRSTKSGDTTSKMDGIGVS